MTMKAYLLIGALVFGASSPAFGADAVVDEVVVVDSTYDWSGVYVGVVAGAAWGDPDYNYNFEDASESTGIDIDGAFGGLTAGYNFQFGNFVAGIEGDISVSDINGSALGDTFPCVDEGCTLDVNWFGTGRLRAGYAFDRFLPYVTGGIALVMSKEQRISAHARTTSPPTAASLTRPGSAGQSVPAASSH
jgi:outer membrane immunogenic protein